MKKTLYKICVILFAAFLAIGLAACSGEQNDTSNNLNEGSEIQQPNVSDEELKIQIDFATEEFLSTFDNIHYFDFGSTHGEGAKLVIWANQPLADFVVVTLSSDVLEDDRDRWGFIPHETYGSAVELLPGEAFVIKNYMGLGTLPHNGVTFVDESGVKRYFFVFENQGYPETGDRWLIWEIEADQLITPDE